MKFKKRDGWMLAGGFALGTLGLKALSSSTAMSTSTALPSPAKSVQPDQTKSLMMPRII